MVRALVREELANILMAEDPKQFKLAETGRRRRRLFNPRDCSITTCFCRRRGTSSVSRTTCIRCRRRRRCFTTTTTRRTSSTSRRFLTTTTTTSSS